MGTLYIKCHYKNANDLLKKKIICCILKRYFIKGQHLARKGGITELSRPGFSKTLVLV